MRRRLPSCSTSIQLPPICLLPRRMQALMRLCFLQTKGSCAGTVVPGTLGLEGTDGPASGVPGVQQRAHLISRQHGALVHGVSAQARARKAQVDLEALSGFLKPDYNPDQDFLPPDLAKTAEARLNTAPQL